MQPTAKVVVLIEATAGFWARAWVVDGALANTFKVSTSLEIAAVRWNLDTLLTQQTSAALVNANAGSWFADGALLWVRPPVGENIFAATVQALAAFYWSSTPRIINDRYYDPRLKSAPGLSQRIEPRFGGVGQTGGGDIILVNNDQFFDALQDLQWDAGQLVLKVAFDSPFLLDTTFQTMATWTADDWRLTPTDFALRVIEPKGKMKSKLPDTFFDRATFPGIDQELIGRPIPIAYGELFGLEPVLIEPGAKRFKVAAHAIRDLARVRVQKDLEELTTSTTAPDDWALYSDTPVYRTFIGGESVKSVTFDGTALTEQNTIEDVTGEAGSWAANESYLYVRPATGQTITSGVYEIILAHGISIWQNANFATKDLANGEFTMDDAWTFGEELSIDIVGKPDKYNAVDIIEDLLLTVGQTNLNAASFTEAASRLTIGLDERGFPVHVLRPAIYLEDIEEIGVIISELLAQIGGFLYSDATGQVTIGVFEPSRGEGLEIIDATDVLDLEELTELEEQPSQINVSYAERFQDTYAQHVIQSKGALQYLRAQTAPVVREAFSLLPRTADATYQAQRMLALEGAPLRTFLLTTAWQGFLWKPGDQLKLEYAPKAIDRVLEILEVSINLANKTTQLLLGDLRSLNDSPGWWIADADVLPVRFSGEAGYGVGSLVWNNNWSDTIKAWARQNVGYWTDANGFANTTDPGSFLGSTWI